MTDEEMIARLRSALTFKDLKLCPTAADLIEALTPSGDTKAAYMGEIIDPETKRTVSWTAIKMVMKMIAERAAASANQPSARDAVIAQLVDAAEAQLQYMDMCGDKGDLERNLRSALFAVKGLKND